MGIRVVFMKKLRMCLRSARSAAAARIRLAATAALLHQVHKHHDACETNKDVHRTSSHRNGAKKLCDEIVLERSNESPVECANNDENLRDHTE